MLEGMLFLSPVRPSLMKRDPSSGMKTKIAKSRADSPKTKRAFTELSRHTDVGRLQMPYTSVSKIFFGKRLGYRPARSVVLVPTSEVGLPTAITRVLKLCGHGRVVGSWVGCISAYI